ncbi:toprim domain-containing protein [Spirosoma foliorum]|uniref:Toprim domain-containing protein n=1 Tax=Spirosoma foliorum TaxID=2710596 RepID=A0A7G5GS55_9BACT|nr:toprim domain-containing protein [Spirosoma foliorum]QMW01697.1 toprim domain-containing protein [Spirosoma foliorum]
MNIDHAKATPIVEILSRLHIEAKRINEAKMRYLSPLRKEKTPSFDVNPITNCWYDHGEGVGGNAVDFACAYLKANREDYTVSDALRWLKNMGVGPYEFTPLQVERDGKKSQSLILKSKKPIQHLGLIHYLQKRGIPLAIAQQYFLEIHVRNKNTRKSFYALGFPNEEGGYELRNPFFKGSLGPKAISFIRGREPKPEGVHLFEGGMDYLSAIAKLNGKRFKDDTIILHSVSCLKQVIPYIQNYGYRTAYSWMDNDPAGEKATIALNEFFKTQADLVHKPMNRIYAQHKDVNAWHMHQLNLTL